MKALYSGTTKELPELVKKARRIGLTITSYGVDVDSDANVTVSGIKHISPKCLNRARVRYTKDNQMEYLTYEFRRGDWVVTAHVSYYDDPYTEGWNVVPMKRFLRLLKRYGFIKDYAVVYGPDGIEYRREEASK